MSHKVDGIIPMYNRAHCVPHLVDTLEKQTMKSFRVIFVDDGSSDNTQQVLKENLENVSFPYLVIKQVNGGAGSARNTGLRASDAEWSVFIDSDDTILPEYLEYLYEAASKNDVDFGYCDFKMVEDSPDIQIPAAGELEARVISAAECMRIHYSNWLSNACLIIKGATRREKNVYYDEECSYTEDNNFLTDLIMASDSVVRVKNVLYLYHIYQGSRSRSPSIDKFVSGIESFKRMERKLQDSDLEAAKVFRSMAGARYYLATYRKAAVQMPFGAFCELAKRIPIAPYKEQFTELPVKQRMAAELLLISKGLFYVMMRTLFKD